MSLQVTFFFEAVQQGVVGSAAVAGWTETWYSNSVLSVDAFISGQDVANYIEYRTRFMHRLYRIPWVRVSFLAPKKTTKIRSLYGVRGQLVDPVDVSYLPQTQCAVLADLVKLPTAEGEGSHHRRFLIRGLPVDLVRGNIINTASPYWQEVINFLDLVANKQTGDIHHPGVPFSSLGVQYHNPAVLPSLLSHVGPAASDPLNLKIQPMLVQPEGTVVQVRKAPNTVRGANRFWTILANITTPVLADSYSILGRARRPVTGVVDGVSGASARVVSNIHAPFDQYTVIGLRSKRTGRPFHQLRGRSSARG